MERYKRLKMWKNIYFLLIIVLLSYEVVGHNGSNSNSIKNSHKKLGQEINERGKRSLNEIEKAFLTHFSQGLGNENVNGLAKYASEELIGNVGEKSLDKEPPFWGTRGRRDGSSESTEYVSDEDKEVKCKPCDKYFHDFHKNIIKEELDPYWLERGVKDKSKEFAPFWGNRGRRDEMEPFWGNRGRREEIGPFWGTRGRRDEMEPFWGNRGRRQENDPFWGTRGRRNIKGSLPGNFYLSNKEGKKIALKENIISAMDNIKYGIENLSRMRRMEGNSFWNNRGRDSKLESLFKQQARVTIPLQTYPLMQNTLDNKPAEPNTVLDERMYAEQPHYILIERSSRSSAEDDPFFISRGKKYTNSKFPKRFRDRRGVLEELVKSVRTDPYYIARGKKDAGYVKIGNSTILKEEFIKAKELICSAVDLLGIKNDGYKVKRDADESERERRTILKKLAAQLQMDPYFVSRGKKNDDTDENEVRLEEFINHVGDLCN